MILDVIISCVILFAKSLKPILFKDDLTIIRLFKSKSINGLSPNNLAINRTVSILLLFFAASLIDFVNIKPFKL